MAVDWIFSSCSPCIAGCVSGIGQVVVGQPFDFVKVRMQM